MLSEVPTPRKGAAGCQRGGCVRGDCCCVALKLTGGHD